MHLKKADDRIWEIDFIRGVAIILMVIFHFIYDLNHFSITDYNLWSGPFSIAAQLTASVFVLLVGISLTIGYNKKKNDLPDSIIQFAFVKRGLKIFSFGLLITLISWIIIPERFVLFGILHCIGICIIFSIPFITHIRSNLFTGSILILMGLYLRMFTFDFSILLPFGFLPHTFLTIDYFPILPWFGVVLYGIALGNYLYPHGQRRYHLNFNSNSTFPQKVCFIGRHSLPIYLVHQPLLVGFIFLFFLTP
jgi:uncharacterized membrane protein